MVLNKFQLEAALHAENKDVAAGRLKEDNPLDTSEGFRQLCEACRRGDLKVCQEKIAQGVNLNGSDSYNYSPLILASLCGHYEVVQHLLENGARCDRDTFQGERCLYNALNDRIRNLLLSYDYSKVVDPLQPLAAHITYLLTREDPQTSDIALNTYDTSLNLHKFILAARSPYFAHKLHAAPETTSWKLSQSIPTESFEIAVRYLYMSEVSLDLGSIEEEQVILEGIDKLSKQLEIDRLFESITERGDRRRARQRRSEEIQRGRDQFSAWFENHVLRHKVHVEHEKADDVKWDRDNSIFADMLLRADEAEDLDEPETTISGDNPIRKTDRPLNNIPIGNFRSRSTSRQRKQRKSVLFPVHRAMLLRSEFFSAMFASGFRESQESQHLQIIPIDCTPEVLEIVLTFLYTEKADFGLDVAVDVLFAADLLFIEKLKQRAAMIISTLGNGDASIVESENPRGETDIEDVVDIYDVIRAGWDTRVHRLEEFGARYIAYRLERFIDDPEFAQIVKESAARIQGRQETDTVELVDDIRYYLSDRYRLRFEEMGMDEWMNEDRVQNPTGSEDHAKPLHDDEGVDMHAGDTPPRDEPEITSGGVIRTLDGEIAGDEFHQDAQNYTILLGKLDDLLEKLDLDA
ncbi:BTB/POZ domain-containing protein 20 [Elsinoe australis]|uniref:BTB/POZ domain-containing protein 20 n=1 Tax=Elsinoe australis TaxID=40998 RepID=A0A4U7B2B4_9PEZI|nr:BTB/POZ domain-containing protein 20 [Elsinoe australis]